MKVLVTGGNGFLGSHVVRILLNKGYEVRAFVLKGTPTTTINPLKCEIFEGNLLNIEDIDTALDGCDYLIHTAAITDVWPTKNRICWETNFELVKSLVEIVKRKKIKKYVHVGTANSFGFGTKENPGTENSPFNSAKYGLDYINSKKAAQDLLLEEAKKESPLPVVIINPTFMIGENDTKPGSGEMIISVIKEKVPGYSTGGRCFAPVKDVALACVEALTKGQIGECYITGGVNLNYQEFFAMIAHITNVKAPKRKVPTFLAILFASIIEFIAKFRKKKPLLTRTMAKIAGDGNYYSSAKACRVLDYRPTSLEVALKEAIAWYDEHGYIKQGQKNG